MGKEVAHDRRRYLSGGRLHGRIEGDGKRNCPFCTLFFSENDHCRNTGGKRRGRQETKKEREKGKGKKENGEKIAVVLKCPKCGQGEIVKGKTAWGCTLYRKSCDFLIPMEIQGKKLTQKQVDTLIQKGQTGKISGFKDPEGNSFNGIVRLDENKNIIVDKI